MLYSLHATLSDGFTVDLPSTFASQEAASRFAAEYMRHYADPCGLGVHVAYVAIREVAA